MKVEDPYLVARMALALLERLPRRDTGRVVLVSSAQAGEGKTFISGLLARELAVQAGGEVALVEAAFAAPTLRAGLALSKATGKTGEIANAAQGVVSGGGFAHLLSHGELPPEALRATETAGLLRLPLGGPQGAGPRAQWLFQPAAVQRALQVLRQRFALTVLDGAPLAECGALAHEADRVVLVVNARRTSRHAIEQAFAAARVDTSRMAGVVLNRHVPELPRWLGG